MSADAHIGAPSGWQHRILPSIETDWLGKDRRPVMQARLTWIKGSKWSQPIQWASCIGAAGGGRA
jgi:hypothetical protein